MEKNQGWLAFSILASALICGGCNGFDTKPTGAFAADEGNGQASALEFSKKPGKRTERESVKAVKAASKHAVSVVCDSVEYEVNGEKRWDRRVIRPDVINAKLAYLPQAGKALGFEKVLSCEDGTRFIDYMNANPELNELFDPAPEADFYPSVIEEDSVQVPFRSEALAKSSIMGGPGAAEKRGVVEIWLELPNGKWTNCTGALLSSLWIMTSAHCLAPVGQGDDLYANSIIRYFDPADIFAEPRLLHAGWINGHMHPPWSGTGDYQSDIGILSTGIPWDNTTIYDYVRIYNDAIPGSKLIYWGQGYNAIGSDGKGTGSGTLRYTQSRPIASIWNSQPYYGAHFVTTIQGGGLICLGDSGGPSFRDDANINFTVGLTSSMTSTNGVCGTSNSLLYSTRVAPKIPWIMQWTGNVCNYMTVASSSPTPGMKYIRCF